MKKNVSDFLNILSLYHKDPYRKSYIKTLYEATISMLKEKELPIHYFTHLAFKKNTTNYLDYIGYKQLKKIKTEVFQPNETLSDKVLFQKFIEENNIPGPVQLAYIEKGSILYNKSLLKEELESEEDTASSLVQLIRHSSTGSIFIKPVDGSGGYGTYKLNQKSLIKKSLVADLYQVFLKTNLIIQETLMQHDLMNQLYGSSINTLRIHTYRKADGRVAVSSALCRIGQGGAFVDNGSSGGLFVPLNIEIGRLEKYGCNYLERGGKTFLSHPDTGVVFDNYQIPYFKNCLELACHAASFFENRIIGWDIAVTSTGPVVIEGNSRPHIVMAQTACKGFRNHPVYNELFKKYL